MPTSLLRRVFAATLFVAGAANAAPPPPTEVARATDILARSVGYATVEGRGQTPAYAAYLAGLLVASGFASKDVTVTPTGGTATLTAVWPGSDPALKPMLVIGHMDVVEAKRADWARDPFTAVAERGYLYGRGVYDDKFDVSMQVATLTALRREGFRPRRTIVLLLSGDEESAGGTAETLAAHRRGAEFALNGDAGGGALGADGAPHLYTVQAAEKVYADYELTVTDPGGHSSRPGPTNAIATLAAAIGRIAAYRFPPRQNEITRTMLAAEAKRETGALADALRRFAANPSDTAAADLASAQPQYVGQIRTTCVPTMLSGGHAPNALPQRASVTVNCRIFPGTPVAEVTAALARVAAEPKAKLTLVGTPHPSDPSPLRPDVMAALRKAVDANAPGLPILPAQEAGATDGVFYRAAGVPTYGVSGIYLDPADDRSHGLDERVPLAAIPRALTHWRVLVTELAR